MIKNDVIIVARLIKKRLWPSQYEKVLSRFYKDDGNYVHRLSYDLTSQSTVLDVGGYRGDWASDIFSKFCCRIHVFEPVEEYASRIDKRFARNPAITVHHVALGGRSRHEALSLAGNGSSIVAGRRSGRQVDVIDVRGFFDRPDISDIDLMKINIEGAEYELLEAMLDANLVSKVRNFQIQFHDCVEDSLTRMERIQRQLSRSHRLSYRYPLVWENWERISAHNTDGRDEGK